MLDINDKILCSSCFAKQTTNSDICDVCGYDNSLISENTGTLPMNTVLLGKYVIGKVLGRGGFGITYLAYDIVSDKKVAIKEYFPDSLSYRVPGTEKISSYTGDKKEYYEDGSEKFYAEAKTLSRFNGNENIINVLEFFYENNTAYYVMEYVDGMDLKNHIRIKGGKLSFKETMDIMNPVLYALIIVHSMDVLHRDISPDNIYITKTGGVKLLDFGAARQIVSEKSNNLSVVLKQGFTPIEQYRKRGNHGPWTDIYSFGATFYFALTGIIPEESINRVEKDELIPPSHLGVDIPLDFEKILMKTLEVKPENRYQSVLELKEAIQGFYKNSSKKNNPIKTKTKKPATKSFFKNKIIIAAAAFIILFILITSLSVFLFVRERSVKNKPYVFEISNLKVEATYTGLWKENNPNGYGEMKIIKTDTPFFRAGDLLSGVFTEGLLQGEGVLITLNNDTYSGNFKDSVFNGNGVMISNGETYNGRFLNGLIDGEGVYTYKGGDMYEGHFEKGNRQGMGKYTYANGDVFEGNFENNMANGNGKLVFVTGDTYDGQFKDGHENGYGVYTFTNGDVYSGEYRDGKWNGYGTLIDINGNVINEGIWENGVYLGPR